MKNLSLLLLVSISFSTLRSFAMDALPSIDYIYFPKVEKQTHNRKLARSEKRPKNYHGKLVRNSERKDFSTSKSNKWEWSPDGVIKFAECAQKVFENDKKCFSPYDLSNPYDLNYLRSNEGREKLRIIFEDIRARDRLPFETTAGTEPSVQLLSSIAHWVGQTGPYRAIN